ncbi:MAG: PilT/PilU family type 4a pilus ATPase [Dehalococcoidia bacterium]|nr:PilT/PilU family type 4a pilus ATPase [Dehalococcoidia bacterium]
MDIKALLHLAGEKSASDLHLIAGGYPVLRIDGRLISIDCDPIMPADMALAFDSITDESQQKAFFRNLELDFAYALCEGTRFRVNACRQKGSISMVFRRVNCPPPGIEQMNLPLVCKDLIHKPNGLVLITGPTGCGKSTTLAAMIGYLNKTEERRVITIEDPIEYSYVSGRCVISQREVGLDTHSFAAALKHALRQDPDVILVGEMRDLETASMVLMAAETGHLVLSTGHASSAPIAVDRIIDLFPTAQQTLAQSRMSAVIQGVMCQTLLRRVDGLGRVPAVEIMLANAAVRNLIREGKTHQLANVIRTSQQIGMCPMDTALMRLFNDGMICREDVLTNCVDKEEIVRMIGESTQLDNSGDTGQFLDEVASAIGEQKMTNGAGNGHGPSVGNQLNRSAHPARR